MRSATPKTLLFALLSSVCLQAAPVLESPLFVVKDAGTIQEMRVPPASRVRILDRGGNVYMETHRVSGSGADVVRWANLPPGVYRVECELM